MTDEGESGSSDLGLEDVEHIADLARVRLEEGEKESFVDEFNEILNYFDKLDEIPDEVEASDDLENVMRADEVEDSLSREEVLGNAPETEDGYIKGPKVS
ncbi:MAG: Asp-tRNA(Asn)/Glu-tRNA(Gln) amidotransferase subunit GatC [Halobacteria archaeon]|nr:Asp-tRNA(Asn)/Glu-tRNA(Gln) amidotransferase subunit GatC [Halobacteria archaeon]